MSTAIAEIKDKMAALKSEYQAAGKEALKTVFAEFFKEFDYVESISWLQYTPYFNDGDPCVFHIASEIEFVPTDAGFARIGLEKADHYSEGEYACQYDLKNYDSATKSFSFISPDAEPLIKGLAGVGSVLGEIEDVLEPVYGDHCRVIVRSDGSSEVEEYSHD